MIDDPVFQNTVVQQNKSDKANENYKGGITTFAGVTVVSSNFLMTKTNATDVDVHISLLFGTDAYAITDLQKLATFKEGPGGVSDPLRQKMTLGWKVGFKAAILNNNFLSRLESGSQY